MQYNVLLSMSFLVATTAFAAVSGDESSFTDVNNPHPNFDAMEYLYENRIVDGYPDGSFHPERPVNRAEFAKIVIGSSYEPHDIETCMQSRQELFPDTPSNAWYAKYICLALRDGVVSGYPNGSFRPSQSINFAEAAKVLTNTFNLQSANNSLSSSSESLQFGQAFTQLQKPWYEPFVTSLSAKHAIPSSISAFNASVTRGEMAEMIYRLHLKNDTALSLDYATLRCSGVEPDDYSYYDLETALLEKEKVCELELVSEQYQSLPEEIGELPYIHTLAVKQAGLTSLPETLWNLTTLKKLQLTDNALTTLPSSISQLLMLRELDLRGNPLTPATISSLSELLPNTAIYID
jgi:Leucine-rich repeat (LRR) protein